jgi:hypothetical protein
LCIRDRSRAAGPNKRGDLGKVRLLRWSRHLTS